MDDNGFTNYNEYDRRDDYGSGGGYNPPPRPPRERPYYSPRDFRAAARQALRGFWLMAILVTFVASLLGGLSSTGPGFKFDYNMDDITITEQDLQEFGQIPGAADTGLGQSVGGYLQFMHRLSSRFPALPALLAFLSILAAIQFLIGGAVMLGYCRFKLHRLDGEEAKFSDLFSAFDQFIEALWMRIRVFLQVFAWSLLLIIPGIVAAYRYALVPYLMADHPNMSVSEAFTVSKRLMKGRKGDLFLLHLSFIGWLIIGTLTLGIGNLVVFPYMQMAEAAFYRNIGSVDPN